MVKKPIDLDDELIEDDTDSDSDDFSDNDEISSTSKNKNKSTSKSNAKKTKTKPISVTLGREKRVNAGGNIKRLMDRQKDDELRKESAVSGATGGGGSGGHFSSDNNNAGNGNGMKNGEGDDDFWNQSFFAESSDSGNESFNESDEDEEDRVDFFDSDFDQSEDDGDDSEDGEKSLKVEKKRKKVGEYQESVPNKKKYKLTPAQRQILISRATGSGKIKAYTYVSGGVGKVTLKEGQCKEGENKGMVLVWNEGMRRSGKSEVAEVVVEEKAIIVPPASNDTGVGAPSLIPSPPKAPLPQIIDEIIPTANLASTTSSSSSSSSASSKLATSATPALALTKVVANPASNTNTNSEVIIKTELQLPVEASRRKVRQVRGGRTSQRSPTPTPTTAVSCKNKKIPPQTQTPPSPSSTNTQTNINRQARIETYKTLYTQEYLLTESATVTESNNHNWLLARKTLNDGLIAGGVGDAIIKSNSKGGGSVTDKHGEVYAHRYASKRGKVDLFTFFRVDCFPDVLDGGTLVKPRVRDKEKEEEKEKDVGGGVEGGRKTRYGGVEVISIDCDDDDDDDVCYGSYSSNVTSSGSGSVNGQRVNRKEEEVARTKDVSECDYLRLD